jgi:hypothetical protein
MIWLALWYQRLACKNDTTLWTGNRSFLITNAHFSYTMRFENQQWFIQPNNNIKVNENQKQK